MMNWKQALIEHSVAASLVVGVVFFLVSFGVMYFVSGWSALAATIVATVSFVFSVAATYMIANNIIDTYTLEISERERHIYQQLTKLETHIPHVKDPYVADTLKNVCKHTKDLIRNIRNSQPKTLLSSLTIIEKWIDIAVNQGVAQYLRIQAEPEYVEDPTGKLSAAKKAFESLDTYLLNSIRAVTSGDVMAFKVAMDMLNTARFDSV